MPAVTDILKTIQDSAAGISLAELLLHHPDVARRTAQRWVSQLIADGRIVAIGEGRARRYLVGLGHARVKRHQHLQWRELD